MITHDSFQVELEKIAKAVPGSTIELPAILEQNLREQRDDLLSSGKKSAYPVAAASGALAGVSIPVIMKALTVGGDAEAANRNIVESFLAGGLEKAFKDDPKLSSLPPEKLKAYARQLASQHYSTPVSLRRGNADLVAALERYTGPEFEAAPGISQKLVAAGHTPDQFGRVTVLNSELGDVLTRLNQNDINALQPVYADELFERVDRSLGSKIRFKELPPTPAGLPASTQQAVDYARQMLKKDLDHYVAQSKGNAEKIIDVSDIARVLDEVAQQVPQESQQSLLNKLRRIVPANSGVTDDQITAMLSKIEQKHGKISVKNPFRARIENVVTDLSHNKPALIAAGILGAAFGLGSVRRKRKKVEQMKAYRAASMKKTSEERTRTDRVLHVLPGVGAVIGGTVGAAMPTKFDPSVVSKNLKPHSVGGRIVSGLLGAGLGGTTMWLPSAVRDTKRALSKQAEAKIGQDDDGNPIVEILGASIEKLDDQKAHGIPIVEAPPGFIYNPELGAFVPNSEDPGWMTQPEAMQAQENANAYQAGQQDTQTQVAQSEADRQAEIQLSQMQPQPKSAPKKSSSGSGKKPASKSQPAKAPKIPTPAAVAGMHPLAQPESPQGFQPPQIQPPGPPSATTVAR